MWTCKRLQQLLTVFIRSSLINHRHLIISDLLIKTMRRVVVQIHHSADGGVTIEKKKRDS